MSDRYASAAPGEFGKSRWLDHEVPLFLGSRGQIAPVHHGPPADRQTWNCSRRRDRRGIENPRMWHDGGQVQEDIPVQCLLPEGLQGWVMEEGKGELLFQRRLVRGRDGDPVLFDRILDEFGFGNVQEVEQLIEPINQGDRLVNSLAGDPKAFFSE